MLLTIGYIKHILMS